MHGTQIWGGRIEGADKSTELWSPHHIRQTLVRSQMRSRRKESNQGPFALQSNALPTELQGRCSNTLSNYLYNLRI